jgi:hypothetical protein
MADSRFANEHSELEMSLAMFGIDIAAARMLMPLKLNSPPRTGGAII